MGGSDREILGQPTKKKTGKQKKAASVFIVGVDEAKSVIYARLKMQEHGPGYIHYPRSADFGEAYFKQLTAETKIIEVRSGIKKAVWKLRQGRRRNEALDCCVYALAAVRFLNPNWHALLKREAARIEAKSDPGGEPGAGKTKKKPGRRRGGFVNRWKE